MDSMWFKLCPKCGAYVTKRDPQESGTCSTCGWQEYVASYYCEFRGRFCPEAEEELIVTAKASGIAFR